MGDVTSARALMGMSLGFHIIYAALGVGLPLLFMIAEGLSLRTGNELYHRIARQWARTAAVLFAIGAVSGTILSFELGLLWPEFMRFAGPIIGMPFSLEGFAFFTEAIFLALYIYGDRRLSRKALFLVTIPATIASALGAIFVISANAWMNTPTGFRVVDGQVVDVNPWRAMFNPAMPYEAVHGTLAAYIATGMTVAGVYAFALLRGQTTDYNKGALSLALAVVGVALPLQFISGDLSARFLAHEEPAKFAAMEGIFETTRGAPLTIGGWADPTAGEVKYGIEIPKVLSILAYEDPNATVRGLNDFPPGTTPDPRRVHLFFDAMVGAFTLMVLAVGWFWWLRWRRRAVPTGKWPLRALVAASPLGLIALECGWMVTEFGRQPWVVQGYLKVSEGVTPREGIGLVFLAFLLLYIALTIGLLWLLLRGPFTPRTGVPRVAEEGPQIVHP